ncbi:tape measure protein [Eggerthellaceae bacterium 24-137]
MSDSEVLASASVEIHPYLSPSFSADLSAQMNGAGMSGAGRRAGDSFVMGMSSSLKGGGRAMTAAGNLLTSKITAPAFGAASAVAGIFAVKGWERLTAIDTAESKLKGLGYSGKQIDGVMKSALASVKGTAYGLGDAANAAVGALAAGVKPGKNLTRVLTTIGDTATIAGGDFNGVANIFGKVMSKGKMQGDEMLQLTERGVPVLQTLAKHLGKTTEEVTEMTSDGKISFEVFEAAMREAFGGAALASGESMIGTIDNMWAAVGRVGAAFLDSGDDGEGFFSRLKPLLGDVTDGIDGMCDMAGEAGSALADGLVEGVDTVKELASDAKEMWDNLSPDQQGQLKALAGIALAAGPALKIMGPLATGLGSVFGVLGRGTRGILAFQGSMRNMAIAANTGKSALGGMTGKIGVMASKSKTGAKAVSGLAGGLSFAAGAVPLLTAGLAAFEVVSFVSELARAQTEAGKLEASFGELTKGHQNMVDAFSQGMQLGTSTDNLMGESGRSMEELQGTVDKCEGKIAGIIRRANKEKRDLRQEDIDDINRYNEKIAAAYDEQAQAHVTLLQQEAKMAPELIRSMSAEEIAAYVGGIKQRGDEALAAENQAYEAQRQNLAKQHSQGVTDEQQFRDALQALQAEHNRKTAAIETATAEASGSAASSAARMSTDVIAAFGQMTEGMGMYSPLVQSGFRDVVDSTQQVQDRSRITADQFREAWASMGEGSIESAAAIMQGAGEASQGMGSIDESTRMAVASILASFDGLSGETAEVGKQALMELIDSLGDPSSVTGGIDTASASCQQIVDAIRDNLKLGDVSQEQVSEYAAAITAGSVVVRPAAATLGDAAQRPLYDAASKTPGIGANFWQGFVNEVSNGAGSAYAAGAKVGSEADRGLRESTKVKSPSRKAMEVGRHFVGGFDLELNAGADTAYRSGYRLGRAATDGLAYASKRARASMAPAIRPAALAAAGGGETNIYYLNGVQVDDRSAVARTIDTLAVQTRMRERA